MTRYTWCLIIVPRHATIRIPTLRSARVKSRDVKCEVAVSLMKTYFCLACVQLHHLKSNREEHHDEADVLG
jgi:hypothetical protein